MSVQNAITDREYGQFPLSIATSLALEGAFGIYPERETGVNVMGNYQELWVNLRTLVRNLLGSVSSDVRDVMTPTPVAEALFHEIELLDSIIAERTNHYTKVVYYVSNYAGMERKYQRAILRRPKTDKQLLNAEVEKKTIKAILEKLGAAGGRDVRVFELKLDHAKPTKALILTHYAFDLLSANQFHELDLLESHTGNIKPSSRFYEKFADGKELPMIPFNEAFLQVFGDHTLFHPWPIGQRREIIELAKQWKWTQVTGKARIDYHLTFLKNHFLRDTLREML